MAKVKYENSLEFCSPNIALEWHPSLNQPITPKDVHNGSNDYAYWLCPLGHTYRKQIRHRTKRGQGCPQCRLENGSFASKHPELLKYWDYEKNGDKKPEKIMAGSDDLVYWVCDNNHSYMQRVNAKSNGAGCPKCSHQSLSEDTCLAKVSPEIAREWHPTKNGNLTPYDVFANSHEKVWWLCPVGHEYLARVYARQRTGCPKCDSEKRTSFPEQAIQFYLGKLFPAESRANVGGYEADIFCPTHKIAIEYDGEFFHEGKANSVRENNKNEYFIGLGITLFRVKETKKKIPFECLKTKYGYEIKVTYSQQYTFVKEVVLTILSLINEMSEKHYVLDIDVIRDKVDIINLYAQQKGENSFVAMKPLGARKWDYEKNGDIDLRRLPKTSKKKYWWKCPTCGYEWYGPLDNIVNTLTCRKCVRQIKPEFEMAPEIYMDSTTVFRELPKNLSTENKDLASQWHPTKNGYFKPIHVTAKSGKRVWWLCPECSYEWPQIIKTRNNGKTARKCPRCANNQKKDDIGHVAVFPEIMFKEWHPTKNGDKKLTDYTPGSNVVVWWKCSKCESDYQYPIKGRKKGYGCKTCGSINSNKAKFKQIRNADTDKVFESVKSAAEFYGINRDSISNCLRGLTKTAGGYRWAYHEDKQK